MIHLVIGPTGSGKSTYIEKLGLTPICFAHELKSKPMPDVGVLHYNMLLAAGAGKGPDQKVLSLKREPILRKILTSKRVDAVTVIVASVNDLLERANTREVIEHSDSNQEKYPSEKWKKTILNSNLFALYEELFQMFEAAGIKYNVVYSSDKTNDFVPSDRVYVHHNLRGNMPKMPSEEEIDAVVSLPGAEYQEVRLPYGRSTIRKGYEHLQGGRDATFSQIASIDFRDRAILDVGSALGDMIFRAERLGATRLVGVEMMPKRFEASRAISGLLSSKARLLKGDFLDAEIDQPFDDVLILNVIHHVSDIRGFLHKAARLADERLIMEFPTMSDKKFRAIGQIPRWIPSAFLSCLPILGVSHSNQDQTFVFTLPAIERILSEVGNFEVELVQSSIANRQIVAFHKVKRKGRNC